MNQQSGKRLRGTEFKEQQKPQHQDSTQRTFHRANRKASDRTETPHPWRASHKNNKMLNPNPLATLLAFNQSKSARTATKGKATKKSQARKKEKGKITQERKTQRKTNRQNKNWSKRLRAHDMCGCAIVVCVFVFDSVFGGE